MESIDIEKIDIDSQEDQLQDEDEISIKFDSFKTLSSYNADLNVETLSSYFAKEKFIMDPDFQRRNVWEPKRKSRFIESLILNLPTPSVLLASDDSKNKFLVIDGKQRLQTLYDFISYKKHGDGFVLNNLEVLSELNGMTYKQLREDPSKVEYLSQLENYVIRATIVKNYENNLLYFIFARLNSGSIPLSTQELRHSLFPGEFSKFIYEESSKNKYIKRILGLRNSVVDKRMKDVELLCRYYAFKYFWNDYETNIGDFLDSAYQKLNKSWKEKQYTITNDLVAFNESIDFIYSMLADHSFKLFSPESHQYLKKSRLLFDILSVFFSIKTNRDIVKSNGREHFIMFFEGLFSDKDFIWSLSPVTSSKEKTIKRFTIFDDNFRRYYKL